MTDAYSPYLNRPLRSEARARADAALRVWRCRRNKAQKALAHLHTQMRIRDNAKNIDIACETYEHARELAWEAEERYHHAVAELR